MYKIRCVYIVVNVHLLPRHIQAFVAEDMVSEWAWSNDQQSGAWVYLDK